MTKPAEDMGRRRPLLHNVSNFNLRQEQQCLHQPVQDPRTFVTGTLSPSHRCPVSKS